MHPRCCCCSLFWYQCVLFTWLLLLKQLEIESFLILNLFLTWLKILKRLMHTFLSNCHRQSVEVFPCCIIRPHSERGALARKKSKGRYHSYDVSCAFMYHRSTFLCMIHTSASRVNYNMANRWYANVYFFTRTHCRVSSYNHVSSFDWLLTTGRSISSCWFFLYRKKES